MSDKEELKKEVHKLKEKINTLVDANATRKVLQIRENEIEELMKENQVLEKQLEEEKEKKDKIIGDQLVAILEEKDYNLKLEQEKKVLEEKLKTVELENGVDHLIEKYLDTCQENRDLEKKVNELEKMKSRLGILLIDNPRLKFYFKESKSPDKAKAGHSDEVGAHSGNPSREVGPVVSNDGGRESPLQLKGQKSSPPEPESKAEEKVECPEGCLKCNREKIKAYLTFKDIDISRFKEMPTPRHAWKDIIICQKCGQAWLIKPEPEAKEGDKCPTCKGTGEDPQYENVVKEWHVRVPPCLDCKGTGKVPPKEEG